MRNQKGQLILTLIIIMTVALAIGLSIIQKSLLDVSTSTKVEQSSRAFSAAEAGVEKYLKNTTDCDPSVCTFQFSDTGSVTNVSGGGLKPVTVNAGTFQDQLEYPPLAKEDVVQVWLADLNSSTPSNPPACGASISCYYTQNNLDVYWGNPLQTDKPAIELTLVYYDGSQYQARKWYLDQIPRNNNFTQGCGSTSGSNLPSYACKFTIGGSLDTAGPLPLGLILLRARLLYNSTSQPFAVQAKNSCGKNCSLPPQAKVLVSTGKSGDTQRKVKVFQEYKVVPLYFDYAIFSAGDIVKQ